MSKIQLTYRFIFDPAETWKRRSAFDSTLGKMFESIGIEAQEVTIEGRPDEKILILKTLDVMETGKKTKQATPKQQHDKIMKNLKKNK